MIRLLPVLGATAALWAACGAVPALADAPRTVPIHMSDSGHILANITVDGAGPYTFIVDTAAGATVVFDDFTERAGLEEVEGHEPIRVQGASGATEARLVRVGQVQMGDWSFPLDHALSMPTPSHITDADGVLGANVLLAQPVEFALGEGFLNIYDEGASLGEGNSPGSDWVAVPMDKRHAQIPFYWVTLDVNGVTMDALVDTGARRTTINSAGAAALGVDLETADLAEDEPIRGATADATTAYVLPVTTVQLGDRIWGSRNFTLADLPIFESIGRAETPTIVFGADFLTEQNFIIDPVESTLWLQKRQSAALGFLMRPTTEVSSAVY